jgi:hypothetical protein
MRYPLVLQLRPSRRAIFLITAIHSIAVIAFALSSIGRSAAVPLLGVLGVSYWLALAAERRKAGQVLVLGDTGLLGYAGTPEEGGAQPLPGCTDFGWAVWLLWREPAGDSPRRPAQRCLMLLPDNLPRSSWRGVRAWLRHKAAAPPGRARAGSSG